MRWFWWAALSVTVGGGLLCAQVVISARAGLLHFFQGEVALDRQQLPGGGGHALLIKPGQELRTGRGRAELILHPGALPYLDRDFIPSLVGGGADLVKPGAALRLGHGGALRILDDRLEKPRFELLAGSAMLDVGELPKNTVVTAALGGATVLVSKSGLYRLDASASQVSTYKGEAKVDWGGREIRLGAGNRLALNSDKPASFDVRAADSLYRWNQWRSYVISRANAAALKLAMPRPPQSRRGSIEPRMPRR